MQRKKQRHCQSTTSLLRCRAEEKGEDAEEKGWEGEGEIQEEKYGRPFRAKEEQ